MFLGGGGCASDTKPIFSPATPRAVTWQSLCRTHYIAVPQGQKAFIGHWSSHQSSQLVLHLKAFNPTRIVARAGSEPRRQLASKAEDLLFGILCMLWCLCRPKRLEERRRQRKQGKFRKAQTRSLGLRRAAGRVFEDSAAAPFQEPQQRRPGQGSAAGAERRVLTDLKTRCRALPFAAPCPFSASGVVTALQGAQKRLGSKLAILGDLQSTPEAEPRRPPSTRRPWHRHSRQWHGGRH